jgi:hypothetical protein
MMRFLLGPELFWLLLYVAATLVAKANVPPSQAIDHFIDQCWFWIPAISMLVFGLWWIPSVERDWLLLRVWLFGLIGGHFVAEKVFSAYSNQGSGAGMGYVAAMIFLFVGLVGGSIFIKIRF